MNAALYSLRSTAKEIPLLLYTTTNCNNVLIYKIDLAVQPFPLPAPEHYSLFSSAFLALLPSLCPFSNQTATLLPFLMAIYCC